jgi:membrane protein YdbS with pleckstrin-like domain
MQCPECGAELVSSAVFCHQCGKRLDSSGAQAPAGSPNPAPAVVNGPAAAFQNAGGSRRDVQPPPEEELWRGGYSSKAMIGAWAICAAANVILLLAGILWVSGLWYWLALLAVMALPWLYNLAVLAYRRMSVKYVLTTQRFLHERGLLRRIHDRIELLDIDDITFEQGLMERMVGVGTIRILASDRTSPAIVLPGIEGVQQVAAVLDNARLAERRRRGLHIEQI